MVRENVYCFWWQNTLLGITYLNLFLFVLYHWQSNLSFMVISSAMIKDNSSSQTLYWKDPLPTMRLLGLPWCVWFVTWQLHDTICFSNYGGITFIHYVRLYIGTFSFVCLLLFFSFCFVLFLFYFLFVFHQNDETKGPIVLLYRTCSCFRKMHPLVEKRRVNPNPTSLHNLCTSLIHSTRHLLRLPFVWETQTASKTTI